MYPIEMKKNYWKAKNQLYCANIPNIANPPKNPNTTMAKDRNKNQKVTICGLRQGCAWWQNDQGSQKGSMPGKPNLLRTKTSKKATNNIRGIGYVFSQFSSTFKYRIAKLLYKKFRLPTMDMLSQDVLNFILSLRTISYWKDRKWT